MEIDIHKQVSDMINDDEAIDEIRRSQIDYLKYQQQKEHEKQLQPLLIRLNHIIELLETIAGKI